MNNVALSVRCLVCSKEGIHRCARCSLAHYCSKDHQLEDWPRHKNACRKKAKTSTADSVPKDVQKPASRSDDRSSKTVDQKGSEATVKVKNNKRGGRNKTSSVKVSSEIKNRPAASQQLKPKKTDQFISDTSSKIKGESVTSSVVHNDMDSCRSGAITDEGSSENEILNADAQRITSTELPSASNVSFTADRRGVEGNMVALPSYALEPPPRPLNHREYPDANMRIRGEHFFQIRSNPVMEPCDSELCQRVVTDMTKYGVCCLDNFLGREKGMLVRNEVLEMYRSGIFQAGQLVSSNTTREAKHIRSDKITWLNGGEKNCQNILNLLQQVDNIILRANKMPNNGKMGDFVINGRTKAMVACYPGSGSHYVKHVDNPNKDGRCITAIYYLNVDWDVAKCGGLLRVFPEGAHQVADIAPIFDRMLFFWSDRRNPHEVQPAYATRYAITLWYFDSVEREDAMHIRCNRANPSKSK